METDFMPPFYMTVEEVKELGWRDMWKMYSSILYHLNEYLTKKWADKETLEKKEEQKRFANIKEWFESYKPDEETRKWYLEKLNEFPNYPIQERNIELTSDDISVIPAEANPYTMSILQQKNFDFLFLKNADNFTNDNDISEIEPLIWKFVVFHDSDNLYNCIKKYIER